MNTPLNQDSRRLATDADARAIAAAILAYRDPSKLVASVMLTDRQRKIIREAHRVAMMRIRHPALTVVYAQSGYIRFLQGGAPGLLQQRIRRF